MKYNIIGKYFFFLSLFVSHYAMAQDSIAAIKIKEIDSLILYSQYDAAKIKADSLYNAFNVSNNRKKYKTQILETRFRQALIIDRQQGSPTDQLKILLEIKDQAEAQNLYDLSCRIYLMMALSYEKTQNLKLTEAYLNAAYKLLKEQKLDDIYSTYCIRKSSYCRFAYKLDSSVYYANEAKIYAEKHNNLLDLADSYLLLGSFYKKNKNYPESLKYNLLFLKYCLKFKNPVLIAASYNNVATTYLELKQYDKALLYNDSSYAYYDQQTLMYKDGLPQIRSKIYESMGNADSAFYYFKQYHDDLQLYLKDNEVLNVSKLEEEYQNEKKEAIIKNKNLQMILITSLLVVIIGGSGLLFRNNRRINHQNKIIHQQVVSLNKTLEQKQVLLSELQHRVKNNLQHVISILEIQKESADFNTIDELIRGSQNRLHSMALLHKKLNVTENVSLVDLNKYIVELSELIKDSYDNHEKQINLSVKCEIETISLEKAMPLGLIIVELVSNSMKHAFNQQSSGMIDIEITNTNATYKLCYADNGKGFDFNKPSSKGLGQEIIKGLIDQLGGDIETNSNKGFYLTFYFK